MPYTSYRLYQQSNQLKDTSRVGLGILHVDIALWAVAKHSSKNRFVCFNELLAMELGGILDLPLANGFVISGLSVSGSDSPTSQLNFWSSISVGEDLPPADCELMLAERPSDAFGILVFDAWIANNDRNETNLTYNSIKNEVRAFDHEQAICNQTGINFLRSQQNDLSCLDCHSIAHHVKCLDGIVPWLDKLQAIPASVILHAVKKYACWLPNPTEYRTIASELVIRQKTLAYLFNKNQNNKELFPSVEKSLIEIPSVCTSFPQSFEVEVPCDNDYRI